MLRYTMGVTAVGQEVRITQKHFTPTCDKGHPLFLQALTPDLSYTTPPPWVVCPHPCPSFKAQGHIKESSRKVPSALWTLREHLVCTSLRSMVTHHHVPLLPVRDCRVQGAEDCCRLCWLKRRALLPQSITNTGPHIMSTDKYEAAGRRGEGYNQG